MCRRSAWQALPLLLALLCALPGSPGAAQEVAAPPPELTLAALANATFRSEFTRTGSATLRDGRFEAPGVASTSPEAIVVLGERYAFGLLGGLPAAAVTLATNTGGSGVFVELAVVVSHGGRAVNVASVPLGDRVRVELVAITHDEVVVEMVQAGASDPACCPTQRVRNIYALQLAQVDTAVLRATTAPASTVGTTWQWQGTLQNDGLRLEPTDPTR